MTALKALIADRQTAAPETVAERTTGRNKGRLTPFPAGETSKSSDCRGQAGRKSRYPVPALSFATDRGAGAPPASVRAGPATTPRRETRRVTFSPFLAQGLPRTAARNPASATATRVVAPAGPLVALPHGALALVAELVKLARRGRRSWSRCLDFAVGGPLKLVRRRGRLQAFRLVARRLGGTALTPPLPPRNARASSRWGVADGKAPRPSVASARPCPVLG